jgi:hypothetical protein
MKSSPPAAERWLPSKEKGSDQNKAHPDLWGLMPEVRRQNENAVTMQSSHFSDTRERESRCGCVAVEGLRPLTCVFFGVCLKIFASREALARETTLFCVLLCVAGVADWQLPVIDTLLHQFVRFQHLKQAIISATCHHDAPHHSFCCPRGQLHSLQSSYQ